LFDCQIIDYLPGFKDHTDKLKQCLELDVNELSENQTWLLILALIDVNEPMNFLREWRMPSKQMKYIVKALSVLKERYQSSWTVASLFYATKEIAIDAEVVYKTMNKQSIYMIKETIENEFSIMPIKTREEIVISGEDLINWFNRPGGPWIKDLLQQIELAILNKEIANDRDEIKGWSRTCNLPFANDC
jgi:tRNA nucleotidyltransferase (CCA-adding enzyme)